METKVNNSSEEKADSKSYKPAHLAIIEQDRIFLSFQSQKGNFEVLQLEGKYDYEVKDLLLNNSYRIACKDGKIVCTCKTFSSFSSAVRCPHILAVENYIMKKEQDRLLNRVDSFVELRLPLFRKDHPDWDIKTDLVRADLSRGCSLIRADIYDEKGNHRSSGMKLEYRKNSSHCENAEVGAIERALAFLGYGPMIFFKEREEKKKEEVIDENRQKASAGQIKYIQSLCKKLKIIPKPDPKNLSKKQASQLISKLQKKLGTEKKQKT